MCCCKGGTFRGLPKGSVQLFCLPLLSSTALLLGDNMFLQSSISFQSLGASFWQGLVLVPRAICCSCARGGGTAARQCDHFSPSSSSRAKGFVPPYLHVSYISTPHLLVSALGHLSPLCEANGTPGKGISSSSTSLGFEHLLLAHTHMGSLYLTNNYLTKYANSIITVICLAIISV